MNWEVNTPKQPKRFGYWHRQLGLDVGEGKFTKASISNKLIGTPMCRHSGNTFIIQISNLTVADVIGRFAKVHAICQHDL
ncbi:hypothetical protein PanWU01x14_191670 [Parasponia andersonii]|uniref:Uncharacterized protein n=1 Tax=Parasponia andersonii TaxID=3476 RepID=A0A2P5C1M2_PARAD|nr:hypothetical protein PanWU01x14_191670 [Parasponia andersonii]